MLVTATNGRGVEHDGCHAHDGYTTLRHSFSIRVYVKQVQEIIVIVCNRMHGDR